jgi:hypothetical protein
VTAVARGFEVQVVKSLFPVSLPVKGDEIIWGTRRLQVSSAHDDATGMLLIHAVEVTP